MQYIKQFVSWSYFLFVITCTTTRHGGACVLLTDATTITDPAVGHKGTVSAVVVRNMTKEGTIERFVVCDNGGNDQYCYNQGVCYESTVRKGVYVCK